MFETGIKVIDLSSDLQGGKIGLSAAPSASIVIMELINNIAMKHGGVSVFGGVGERNERATISARVPGVGRHRSSDPSKPRAARLRTDTEPGARLCVARCRRHGRRAFRDAENRTCCSLSTNIPATGLLKCRRCSAACRRRRLPADAAHGNGRAAGAHHIDAQGSITSVQAIYVPAETTRIRRRRPRSSPTRRRTCRAPSRSWDLSRRRSARIIV